MHLRESLLYNFFAAHIGKNNGVSKAEILNAVFPEKNIYVKVNSPSKIEHWELQELWNKTKKQITRLCKKSNLFVMVAPNASHEMTYFVVKDATELDWFGQHLHKVIKGIKRIEDKASDAVAKQSWAMIEETKVPIIARKKKKIIGVQ